jgi:hypothetical protein
VSNGSTESTEGSQPDPTEGSAPAGQNPEQPTEGEQEDDLSKSKRHASHWQAQARRAEKERNEAKAELEALRLSQKSEHEQAVEKARKEGATEAAQTWRERFHVAARRNEAMRIMSGRVVDPDLVMPHLGLDDVGVDDDGNVDTSAIEAAVAAALERYPVLAHQDGQPTHHADLGPKRRPAQTTDVNRALREAMMPGARRR